MDKLIYNILYNILFYIYFTRAIYLFIYPLVSLLIMMELIEAVNRKKIIIALF